MTTFNEYLFESKTYSNKTLESIISKDVGHKIKIEGDSIFIGDSLILKNYNDFNYQDLIQRIVDHIIKNIGYDELKDVSSYFKSIFNNNSRINIEPLKDKIKRYSNNSVIVQINELDPQILGISSNKSIQEAADQISDIRYGYTLYVLDGDYKAIKLKVSDSISGWVLDSGFEYERSIGATQVLINNKLVSIKHIRKKL